MPDNLTPTAQTILDNLRDGPTTTTDLRERAGRSRSTIDKALTELTKAGLIAKAESGGDTDAGGGSPALWELTGPTPAEHTLDDEESQDGEEATDQNAAPPAQEEVKICRGCQNQMPKICPGCWQKTTTYCGDCRKDNPTTRRGTPGDPQILSNGLPKLARGELERHVLQIIRSQPSPEHLGITGWTSGRVAVFLPGRSTGAIGNVLDKLAATGLTQLLGDNPKRYQLTPDTNSDTGTDATEPATDAPPDGDQLASTDVQREDTEEDDVATPDPDPSE